MAATTNAWYRVGKVLHERGDVIDALTPYYKALGPAHEETLHTAMVFLDIGRIHHTQNSIFESLHAYAEALRITRQVLGDYSLYVAKIMDIMGNLLVEQGRVGEAMQFFAHSMRIQLKGGVTPNLRHVAIDPLVLLAATPRNPHAPSA